MFKFASKGIICAVLFLFSFNVIAQKTVTGIVASDAGKTLQGATAIRVTKPRK